MRPYADTNLFCRFYLELPGSAAADELIAQARTGKVTPLAITWLHCAELVNAFEFSVWLGRQPGHPRVTAQQAAVAWATFREDLAAGGFIQRVRLDEADLERQFESLALRHTARHGFRAYDLLHVAAALLLACDTFWSFDERARKLAALKGLHLPA